MKKLLLSSLALAALTIASSVSAAGSINQGFNVTATLSPSCIASATNAATAVLDFGTYVAFGAGPTIAAPNFTSGVDCSRLLAAAPTAAITGGDFGVVAGLNYTLAVVANAVVAGTNATAVAGATNNGTADKYTFKVTGTMAGGQPGQVGAPTSDARVLVISF
jgi:hypothetical protein